MDREFSAGGSGVQDQRFSHFVFGPSLHLVGDFCLVSLYNGQRVSLRVEDPVVER